MSDPSKVDKTTKINMHPLNTDINLDKHDIGLSQVDNLSLVNSIDQMNTNVGVINASIDALTYSLQQKLDKSLAINGQTIGNSTNVLVGMSSLNQTIFNSKEDKANKNEPNGYAGLDSNGQLPSSVFPSNTGMLSYKGIWDASLNVPTLSDSSIESQGSYYIVSFSGTTQLNNINKWNVDDWIISNGTSWLKISNSDLITSVNSQTGNVVIDKSSVGLSNVDNTSDLNKTISTATQDALDLKTDKTTTINSYSLSSDITLSKSDIGLGNVDNTADVSKPISTATQTALALKQDTSAKNQPNGYAGLDATSKLTSSQLPLLSLGNGSITDVAITAPTATQILSYDGTQWINTTASGGSGGLTSTDVVTGTGEGTSSVPDTTIRGAQAAGANVQPGDLIIRPPGGTGLMGSGSIRFQVAIPSRGPYLEPFRGYLDYSGASTFISSSSASLSIIDKISNILAVVICASNVTITTFTLGGITHIPLYSQQVGSGRLIVSAFMNIPATSASATCTFSSSTRVSIGYYLFDTNDWDGTITTGLSSTATTTTASVTFTDLLKGDLIFNCFVYRIVNVNVAEGAITIPGERRMSQISDSGNPSRLVVNCKHTRLTQNELSYTMTSTYTTLVNNIGHVGFYLRYKPSTNTTVPTFTDVITISPFGQMSHILDDKYFLPALSVNLPHNSVNFLTNQSPRRCNYSVFPYPNGAWSYVVLPDPRTLNIGCKYVITLPAGSQYQFQSGQYFYFNASVVVPTMNIGVILNSTSGMSGQVISTNSNISDLVKIYTLIGCNGLSSIWQIDSVTTGSSFVIVE